MHGQITDTSRPAPIELSRTDITTLVVFVCFNEETWHAYQDALAIFDQPPPPQADNV